MQFGRIYAINLIVLGILLEVQFVLYPCTNCVRIQRSHAKRASFDKEGRTLSRVDPTNYLAVYRDAAGQTLSRLSVSLTVTSKLEPPLDPPLGD